MKDLAHTIDERSDALCAQERRLSRSSVNARCNDSKGKKLEREGKKGDEDEGLSRDRALGA
jgi:hypothetical protein